MFFPSVSASSVWAVIPAIKNLYKFFMFILFTKDIKNGDPIKIFSQNYSAVRIINKKNCIRLKIYLANNV